MTPFLLYPILSIIYSLYIIKKQKWNGKKLPNITQDITSKKSHVSLWEKIGIYAPVIFTFIITVYTVCNQYSIHNQLSEALKHIDLSENLLLGICSALVYCILLYAIKHKSFISPLMTSIKSGALEMKEIATILIFVWTLTLAIKSDGISLSFIAQYLASCSYLLPMLFFVSSILLSAALISAWGSIALNMSLVPFFIVCYPNIYVIVGAIVSGALAGCQLSPAYNELVIALIKPETKFKEYYKIQLKTTLMLSTACCIGYIAIGLIQKGY